MADYKWKVGGQILCPGADWLPPEVYPNIDWTDGTSTTGSRETQAVIRNADTVGYQCQRVDVNVSNSWSVRWDKNNFMYVDLACNLNSISGSIYQAGAANIYNRTIMIRNYEGGPALVNFEYSANATGLIRGSQSLGTWTLGPIAPKSDSSKNSFYLANWATGFGSEDTCTGYGEKYTVGIQFRNNRALEYDKPTISATTCEGYSTGGKFSATVDFGEYRNGASVIFQVSDRADFSNIVFETTKSGTADRVQTISTTRTGFQPNTRYYVRYQANNGAKDSDWTSCNFVTLVTNNLSEQKAVRWDEGSARLAIQMGGNEYTNPQTKIYIRKCGQTTWVEKLTRTTKTVANITLDNLEANSCYEIQARTTTAAGTYTGNTVSFTTPDMNIATAHFTSIDPEYDEDANAAIAHVCYDYETDTVPVDITVYYRVKNGFDPTWLKSETTTFNEQTGSFCLDLEDLIPNQTVYETYLKTTADGNDWQGEMTEFITPIQPIPDNCTCANMAYLVDLICQAVKPLYKGNKTIYANQTTKDLCDPYSKNPTLATLWSRLLRFDHAAVCVMCDMLSLMKVKGGRANQYYTGETGWVDLATEIVEGAVELPSSKTVKDYLAEKLHEVWHFHTSVSYLTGTVAELPTTGLEVGDDAIEASTSHLYKWNGSTWAMDSTFEVGNFAVFHIENALDSSFGHVKANTAYYYFEGTWNNLDADTRELEHRIEILEAATVVEKANDAEDDIMVQTNDADFDYTTLPSGKRVVCFVTEPVSGERVFYPVKFWKRAGELYKTIQVESGRKATAPQNPTEEGRAFNRWVTSDLSPFDFNTPITEPLDLYAEWTSTYYTVTFNSNGGTPSSIPSQSVAHGSHISNVTVTRSGYSFGGWYNGTDLVDAITPITSNMNLVASWTPVDFVVVYDPKYRDGSGVTEVTYYNGQRVTAGPFIPSQPGAGFQRWETEDGLAIYFPFVVRSDMNLHAVWSYEVYRVQFDSDGGSAVPSQFVKYDEMVQVPTPPPTKSGSAFAGWYDTNTGAMFDFSQGITRNYNLIAHWDSSYVITFNANGGVPVPPTQYVLPGDLIEDPGELTKAGHEWEGWMYNGSEWDFSVAPTGDMTIEASFIASNVMVGFAVDPFDPVTEVPQPAPQVLMYGSNAVNPWPSGMEVFESSDNLLYYCAGWTLNGVDYDFTSPVTSDITLYAKWEVKPYGIITTNDTDPQVYEIKTLEDFNKLCTTDTSYTFSDGTVIRADQIKKFDFTNQYITSIGDNFLRQTSIEEGNLTIPSSVTSIGNYFLYSSSNLGKNVLSSPVTAANVATIGYRFMSSCAYYNGSVNLSSVTSIGMYFLADCLRFNTDLRLPNTLTSIDAYFMYNDIRFNSVLTLSNTLASIGANFMSGCTAFAQTLELPSTLASIGTYFMNSCDNFVGPLVLECKSNTEYPIPPSDQNSLSTTNKSKAIYATGVTLQKGGTGVGYPVERWKNSLPNRTSSPYRKLL